MKNFLVFAAIAILISGCCCRSGRRMIKLESERLPDAPPTSFR
jgi:hypothetical protein